MKRNKLIIIIIAQIILFTGCINYQAIADKQFEQETTVGEKFYLGDMNNDGRTESLVVDGWTIKLLADTKVLAQFEPNKSIEYLYASGTVIDIDNDNTNEVVIYAATKSDTSIVFASIYLIDVDENQKYYLREFPNELASIYSTTGIDADISIKDKFLYEIKCENKKIIVDVSRIYGLSTISVENQEKLDEEWKKIVNNNYKGEVIGIVKSEIVLSESGKRKLKVYELVKGADKKDIGYIIATFSFDATGKYYIDDIDFMERTDVQP